MADFEVGAGSLGFLVALQLLTYTLMQVPAGALADSFGPRRVLGFGALLTGIGVLLFSLAPSFPVAVAGRMVLGLGDSLVFLNVLRLQADWFRPREYATLAGLTGLASGLGGLAAGAPLALAVEGFGWRPTLAATGLLLLGVAALCWLALRDRPSDVGLPSWDEVEGGAARAGPVPASLGARLRALWENLPAVAGNRTTWMAMLSHMAQFAPYLVLTTAWGIPYLMQVYGLSRPTAGAILSLAPLFFFLGGPTAGYLSDRIGRRRAPMLVVEALVIVSWILLVTRHDLPSALLAVLFCVAGLGGGACLLAFAAAKEANPPAYSGLATGFTNLGGFGGAAVLQVVVGLLLDLRWNGQELNGARLYPPEAFSVAFLAILATAVVGTIGTFRMRETFGC
jgi:sugar phosphate permease